MDGVPFRLTRAGIRLLFCPIRCCLSSLIGMFSNHAIFPHNSLGAMLLATSNQLEELQKPHVRYTQEKPNSGGKSYYHKGHVSRLLKSWPCDLVAQFIVGFTHETHDAVVAKARRSRRLL